MFPILRAGDSFYSRNAKPENPDSDEKQAKSAEIDGQELTLVSGYQSLNNHRAVISGSIQMCSDELMATSKDNLNFCLELTNWAVQESGVIRSSGVKHWNQKADAELARKEKNPENYKLEEHVHFEIGLELKMAGKWQPF